MPKPAPPPSPSAGETLIAIESGIDTRSAAISAPKGSCSNMLNWEKDQGPGLVRRQGWARYDGRIQGPEIEDGVVVTYNAADQIGVFSYGEQVLVQAPGRPDLTVIYLGSSAAYGGFATAHCFAYPIEPFSQWDDITSYPAATQYAGLSSGAFLSTGTASPTLMNASTIDVMVYDNLKRSISQFHAASVGAVPGRNESPVDAAFAFNDKSYAIHDCVLFTFTNGNTVTPLEGHQIYDTVSGNFLGTLLSIQGLTGDWSSGGAAGTFVVYDYPLGQAFPATGDFLDLFSADGTTLLVTRFAKFGSAAPADVDAGATRAILYSTYDQYVKTYPFNTAYGRSVVRPPPWETPTPPTWTRPRLTRELPYKLAGSPAGTGFGPVGTAQYSQYEYTRLGLSTSLQALSPITTADTFPTIATDVSGTGRWTNPNNILAQDGAVATSAALATAGSTTAFIRGTGFDFSAIPEGSTILGVQVRLRASASLAATFRDFDVRLVSAAFPNGIGGTNKRRLDYLTNVLTDYTYGGSADLWDQPELNDFVVRDPSFGFQARWIRATTGAAQTVSVDAFAIQVTYIPPSRVLYVRDPSATVAQDVPIQVLHYCIDKGSFAAGTAEGVLSIWCGDTEAEGTAAGKTWPIATGFEIRTAPSTSGTNAPNGTLLAYCAGEDYPVTFPPSKALDAVTSRYEIIDANFWDTPDGRAAYIANGAEYACMWDGTYLVRIRCGRPQSEDNPRHVAAHLSILHLGFASGTVAYTADGHPLSFLEFGNSTAGVYNFGEPITGMLTLNGSTLGVWTDRATRGLQGNKPYALSNGAGSGYTPIMISPAINCIEYSLVNLVGEAVWCSYRGVETVRTVQAYGDFETLPLSAAAQGWLQGRLQVDLLIGSMPSRVLYAVGVRNKRQYRVYFADGFCFTLTMFDAGDQPVCTIQQLYRPNSLAGQIGANQWPTNAGVVRHLYNGVRSDGKEVIFATWENQNPEVVPASGVNSSIGPYFPYVARIDCGYTDDLLGYINNWVEFNAFYAGIPSQIQRWGSMTLFLNAYGRTQVKFYTKTDFDGPIFDYTPQGKGHPAPADPRVQARTLTLPLIEYKAYIPVPSRTLNTSIDAEGPCLKLLIDGTQDATDLGSLIAPSLVPIRITHIALTSTPTQITQN